MIFNKKLITEVAILLNRHRYTISAAESVTAGLLQAALASGDNASEYFEGGLTAYNAKQKYKHLEVDMAEAAATNSVSVEIARRMAVQVSYRFSSDWGIGITGYAASLSGHYIDPLYAYFAISYRHVILKAGIIQATQKDFIDIQLEYVDAVLVMLASRLRAVGKE